MAQIMDGSFRCMKAVKVVNVIKNIRMHLGIAARRKEETICVGLSRSKSGSGLILISRSRSFEKTLHWKERLFQCLIRLKATILKWTFFRIPVCRNFTEAKVLSVEELTALQTKGLEGIGACDGVTA